MIENNRTAKRKQILRFALPIYCSNLLQQLYQATDMIILGQFFGNNAIAAVGATASLVYMIIHVIGGITTGLSVIPYASFNPFTTCFISLPSNSIT